MSGAFTVEAAVIVPIIMLITVCLLTTSIDIHNSVTADAQAYSKIIENAPALSGNAAGKEKLRAMLEGTSLSVNPDNLDARQTILKYRLIKDGLSIVSGGLFDED